VTNQTPVTVESRVPSLVDHPAVRDQPEPVSVITRNRCPPSPGTGVRDQPDYALDSSPRGDDPTAAGRQAVSWVRRHWVWPLRAGGFRLRHRFRPVIAPFAILLEVGSGLQAPVASSQRSDQPVLDERFEELSAGFLRGFPYHTARAYRGDLGHLRSWLSASGQAFFQLNDLLLFRYLLTLARHGYSSSTIRRRITCLRAFVTYINGRGEVLSLDVDTAAERVRLAMRRDDVGATSLLVVSDDVLVGSGLEVAASSSGIVDTSRRDLEGLGEGVEQLGIFDYALVHIWPSDGDVDRLRAVDTVALLVRRGLTSTVIVIASFDPKPLVSLRLAEAGCGFCFPYSVLRGDPGSFFDAMRSGEPDDRFVLPTQWALRQSLGLRWNGEVAPFLALARTLPARAWTTDLPQSRLGVGRSVIRQVQAAARDVAGLPEPSFSRYASSLRKPPELPEWPRVRSFVRDLWGLSLR